MLSSGVGGVWSVACGVLHTDRGCITHQLLEESLPQAQSVVRSVLVFALSCSGVCVLSFYTLYLIPCTLFLLAICIHTGAL